MQLCILRAVGMKIPNSFEAAVQVDAKVPTIVFAQMRTAGMRWSGEVTNNLHIHARVCL